MRIVFFGTPQFAAGILEHLVLKGQHHQVIAVVSKPDAPKGRGQRMIYTPVHEAAERLLPGVPYRQPTKVSDPEVIEFLRSLQADIFLVVAYGEIVKKSVLDIPRYGCLNIHASLLPFFRGAAPIHRAIMHGDTRTGVTIMRMDVGLDSGDILLQKETPISLGDTFHEVELSLLSLAKDAILESLDLIEEGRAQFIPQENSLATLAPKIHERDLLLCPEERVDKLHNQIRALSPKPGAYFHILVRGRPFRLKVFSSVMMEGPSENTIPTLKVVNGHLALLNSSGILLLKKVQLEGKSSLSSEDFLRGYPLSCLTLS